MHLDKLKKDKFFPLSDAKRIDLLSYYGENLMKLPIRNRVEIFIEEMLTPFEVFQTYGIILWIYE
jgi:cation-transporting ATPase 13A2